MTLSPSQQQAIDATVSGKSPLLITGGGGTGKTHLLHLIKKSLTEKKRRVVVLAPTGVAAIHAGGQTVHKFFRFPLHVLSPEAVANIYPPDKSLFKEIDTIIIDEASMLRCDLVDGIDVLMRRFRQKDKPFGGTQMVFIADPYQLPAVILKNNKDEHSLSEADILHSLGYEPNGYFFNAHVFKTVPLSVIELTTNYRQGGEFLKILNSLRQGQLTESQLAKLNQRTIPIPKAATRKIIYLSPNRAGAAELNQHRLMELTTPLHTYAAKVSGSAKIENTLASESLQLRKGARVMFIANYGGLANGSLGTVVDLDNNSVTVEPDDHRYGEIRCGRKVWEQIFYKKDGSLIIPVVGGSIEQIPLILAWAITIHKAQGLQFPKVAILNGGSGSSRFFENGHLYVALSRCEKFTGLYLSKELTKADVQVSRAVVKFFSSVALASVTKEYANG